METGKPRLEATNVDVMSSLSVGRFAITQMGTLFRPKRVDLGRLDLAMRAMGRGSYLHARPLGVVGVITPWNYPFGLPYSQTVMALAAGNAAIVKPSSEAPLSAQWVEKAAEKCGLPEDLVQVLLGGGTVGRALLTSGLDRVIFTGSVEKGREVMGLAAQRLTPVTLELGGKDPFIVLHDADLERTVRGAVWGAFVNAGQTCAGVKRIYVQREPYPTVSPNRWRCRPPRLKMGWGWDDPDVSMGPIISEQALREVETAVSRAIQERGPVHHRWSSPSDFARSLL